MNWLIWIAAIYLLIAVAVGGYALYTGTTIKEAVFTGFFWPLSAIFIIGMLGR